MWCRPVLAASLSVLLASPLAADELDDFNAAVERFSAYHRVALHYLRTGNVDFAVIELDRMREAWGSVVDRFAGKRPAAITDVALYTLTLTDVSTRMIGARLVLDMGRADVAAGTLDDIRGVLARLRQASGIVVLADCVLAANMAMDALTTVRDADLAQEEAATDVLAKASRYAGELKRCETIASPVQRADPEFRRLVDGAMASLTLMREAVEQRDSALLGRLIDELRAFDRLLAFRFG
jgi:hypothetical protein